MANDLVNLAVIYDSVLIKKQDAGIRDVVLDEL